MLSLSNALLLALAGSAFAAPIETVETIETRQTAEAISDTENGLAGACMGTTVIFARGTLETGNVGTLAGPAFFKSLSADLGGDLAVQGVEYAADIPGFLVGGDPIGSATM